MNQIEAAPHTSSYQNVREPYLTLLVPGANSSPEGVLSNQSNLRVEKAATLAGMGIVRNVLFTGHGPWKHIDHEVPEAVAMAELFQSLVGDLPVQPTVFTEVESRNFWQNFQYSAPYLERIAKQTQEKRLGLILSRNQMRRGQQIGYMVLGDEYQIDGIPVESAATLLDRAKERTLFEIAQCVGRNSVRGEMFSQLTTARRYERLVDLPKRLSGHLFENYKRMPATGSSFQSVV